MIVDIIQVARSKTRRSILELFFRDPGKEYYLRQIESLTGFSVGNIRREMLKLEASGLFSKRTLGRVTLYKLDTSYSLYNEIKNIVHKTIGIEGRLRAIANRHKKIKFAFIYGSFAKEKEAGLSDIDILIIGKVKPRDIKAELYKYQSEIQKEINSTVYATDEFLNKLKEKNHFLNAIIKEPNIFLKGTRDEFREFIQIRKT